MKNTVLVLFGLTAMASSASALEVYFMKCRFELPKSQNLPKPVFVEGYGKNVQKALDKTLENCKAMYEKLDPGACDRAYFNNAQHDCDAGIYIPY